MAISNNVQEKKAKGFALCSKQYNLSGEIEDLIFLTGNKEFGNFLGHDLASLKEATLSSKDSELLAFIKKQKPNSLSQYSKNGEKYKINIQDGKENQGELLIDIDTLTPEELELIENSNKEAFSSFVQDLPIPMFITDKIKIVDCNEACFKLFGFNSRADFLAENPINLSTPTQKGIDTVTYFAHIIDQSSGEGIIGTEWVYVKKDGSYLVTETTYNIKIVGEETIVYSVLRDLTEERKAQEALSNEQEKIISALSTPITQLAKGMLFLPLVGDLSQSRANSILNIALERISYSQGKVLIVDIAGVKDMDMICAHSLLKLSKATRLMGCTLILSSLSPNAAETLINLDINMSEFMSSSNLETAIHQGFAILGLKIDFQKKDI